MAEAAAGLRVGDAVSGAARALERAGCDSPRLDAELLLAHAMGVTRERLLLDREQPVGEPELGRFQVLIARRAEREPVAYILGRKPFRHLTLAVDRRVLIPRPESELLVEVGLELERGVDVVDVGTGSGAVALALKHERPDLILTGTDSSPQALEVARANARALGLEVGFVRGDLLAGVRAQAVLANLPYVAEGAPVAPEVAGYEPPEALFAGAAGLAVIRRLVAGLDGVALAALEIGSAEQARAVAGLLTGAGFGAVEVRSDLAGLDRVVVARR